MDSLAKSERIMYICEVWQLSFCGLVWNIPHWMLEKATWLAAVRFAPQSLHDVVRHGYWTLSVTLHTNGWLLRDFWKGLKKLCYTAGSFSENSYPLGLKSWVLAVCQGWRRCREASHVRFTLHPKAIGLRLEHSWRGWWWYNGNFDWSCQSKQQ